MALQRLSRVSTRALSHLATLSLVAVSACSHGGSTEPGGGVTPPPPNGPAVDVWMTTASGAKLLSHESDIHFGTGTPPAGTT
ncbi:MAG TPA: hypothetical protein VFN39_10985, partial [Gemmatimonadaceae bacterium]|nr:hypothetical protein [Gemmatimonadaceae bacterium]